VLEADRSLDSDSEYLWEFHVDPEAFVASYVPPDHVSTGEVK